MTKTIQQWRQELGLDKLEVAHGLPRGLLTAVMQAESGGNPNIASSAGAVGLFQIMPRTAQQYGVTDRKNPVQSAQGAAALYEDLAKMYNGDIDKMLAGYNWGSGHMEQNGNDLSRAPKETKDYILKVRGTMASLATADGRYQDAANYSAGSSSYAMNVYSAKNRVKAGNLKTRSPNGDEEDQSDHASFLASMMEENPGVALFLLFVGLATGIIQPSDMNDLLDKFDALPEDKRQIAINSLSPETREKYYSASRLREFSRNLDGSTAGENAAILAKRLEGQAEVGKNCGDIVSLVGVPQGMPWCGGFANYIMSVSMPGVYQGENFNLASNFEQYGKKYNAFYANGSSYLPQKGDIVVLKGEGPSGRHVGIVTDINPDGSATYIAGNESDKVASKTVSFRGDSSELVGFTSSGQIAAARGIDLSAALAKNAPAINYSSTSGRVYIGDSIASGSGSVDVNKKANLAVVGSPISMVARQLNLLPAGTTEVVLSIGTNDAATVSKIGTEAYKKQVATILSQLQERGVSKISILSVNQPSADKMNEYPDLSRNASAINGLFNELAQDPKYSGSISIIDTSGIAKAGDGIHFKDYRQILQRVNSNSASASASTVNDAAKAAAAPALNGGVKLAEEPRKNEKPNLNDQLASLRISGVTIDKELNSKGSPPSVPYRTRSTADPFQRELV